VTPTSRTPLEIPADEVRACLERILASPQFAASERLKRFLTFAVEQYLESADGPKEYEIGVRVYDRGEQFDPSRDSIVRTEAARLRKRLDEYYQGAGGADVVRLEIPRGSYRATFTRAAPATPDDVSVVVVTPASVGTRPPVWWAVAATLAVSALAAIWGAGLVTVGSGKPGREPGYVLVGEFVNRTGDAALDGAIESAVEAHLTSQAGLQPLPVSRVDDALRLMARPVDTRLSSRVARDVALRDGAVRAVLDGALRGRAAPYELTARITDPASGHVIDSYLTEVRDGQVLVAARSMADWVRIRLGGAAQPSAPLEAVTTASLRAVQLYSQANREGLRGRWSHAETLLEQALIEDPQFASAHLLLAWARRNQYKSPDTWKAPLADAVARSARSTEVERLFIVASSHSIEGRDHEAGIAYESLLQLAPDHYWANNNLALTQVRRDPLNAGLHYRRIADLRPNDAGLQVRAAWSILTDSDAIHEASRLSRRARALGLNEDRFRLPATEAFEAWARNDIEAAVAIMQAMPEQSSADEPVNYALFVGMPMAGLGMERRARAAVSAFGGGAGDRWDGWIALVGGDLDGARTVAGKLTNARPNALNAILLARVGMHAAADEVIRGQGEMFAVGYDPSLHQAVWDVARAEVLIARGRTAAAEKLLVAALAKLEPAYGSHLEYFLAADQLGALLSMSGRGAEARTVLERAVARRRRAFAAGLSFWRLCAVRLERLLREEGDERAVRSLRDDLDRILTAADVKRTARASSDNALANR
jgi:tetratricopeptide (TPR) repeat protein